MFVSSRVEIPKMQLLNKIKPMLDINFQKSCFLQTIFFFRMLSWGMESPAQVPHNLCPCTGVWARKVTRMEARPHLSFFFTGCDCELEGVLPEICDSQGRCLCRPGVEGPRCDACRSDAYSFPICQGKWVLLLGAPQWMSPQVALHVQFSE